MGHGGTGTVVPSRKGFPKDLGLDRKDPKGSLKAAVSLIGKMLAVAWMDKKTVFFLTNCHKPVLGSTQRREGPDRVDVDCPEVALAYNNHKDAVDQYDKVCLQDLKSLEACLTAWKWWHRMWWGLLDGAIANASIIWMYYHTGPEDTRTEFMNQLQEEMLTNTLDCCVAQQARQAQKAKKKAPTVPRLDGVGHFLKYHEDGDRAACKWCAYNLKGTKTRPPRSRMWCEKCQAHLCGKGKCNEFFHTVEDRDLDRTGQVYVRNVKKRRATCPEP